MGNLTNLGAIEGGTAASPHKEVTKWVTGPTHEGVIAALKANKG